MCVDETYTVNKTAGITVMQMLKGAEPLGQMEAWQGAPGTTNICFERIPMPDGYMVLGDAMASLIPRFATGMTISAQQVPA